MDNVTVKSRHYMDHVIVWITIWIMSLYASRHCMDHVTVKVIASGQKIRDI